MVVPPRIWEELGYDDTLPTGTSLSCSPNTVSIVQHAGRISRRIVTPFKQLYYL